MAKIKKNDIVVILKGKCAGDSGKVLRVKGRKVVVEGINLVKKCVRANPNAQEQGGIKEVEASLAISNVALAAQVTKNSKKPYAKVGYKFLKDGKKVRYFKHNGELVDV